MSFCRTTAIYTSVTVNYKTCKYFVANTNMEFASDYTYFRKPYSGIRWFPHVFNLLNMQYSLIDYQVSLDLNDPIATVVWDLVHISLILSQYNNRHE